MQTLILYSKLKKGHIVIKMEVKNWTLNSISTIQNMFVIWIGHGMMISGLQPAQGPQIIKYTSE